MKKTSPVLHQRCSNSPAFTPAVPSHHRGAHESRKFDGEWELQLAVGRFDHGRLPGRSRALLPPMLRRCIACPGVAAVTLLQKAGLPTGSALKTRLASFFGIPAGLVLVNPWLNAKAQCESLPVWAAKYELQKPSLIELARAMLPQVSKHCAVPGKGWMPTPANTAHAQSTHVHRPARPPACPPACPPASA